MKRLSKKNSGAKNSTVSLKAAAELKTAAKQAQCCAKVSRVVAGCHD